MIGVKTMYCSVYSLDIITEFELSSRRKANGRIGWERARSESNHFNYPCQRRGEAFSARQ